MRSETLFRALGDSTRLRILHLIGSTELAIGELAAILNQSQPRVSRHVAILCDAGLAERRREGSWVFIRAAAPLARDGQVSIEVARLLAAVRRADGELGDACRRDVERLEEIKAQRESAAAAYFAAHAHQWDELRRMHSPDTQVEDALLKALGNRSIGHLLDLGTGTGRMAELMAPLATRVTALDKSLDMLRLARARLQHLPQTGVEVVHGDLAALPFAAFSFDTVLLHQVLHFVQDPVAALLESARVTAPGGRVAVVDFASHQLDELRERHAHVRLGFADDQMAQMFTRAGLVMEETAALEGGRLVVKIWIAAKPDHPVSASVPSARAS
ncbi:metalloregulator ArsR/SmtB family transcription factor [Erythrobacteraceae bacterium CFH 75059]|uniref:ArsR/SmtB family transcription factor n=1 Tax=Qipengyuania thermophila TaxID=2509361 RepID=UPI00101EA6FF|nr:metalloregulator ArsR/SmtB family transcription factor [Qipengyuania thermophila]TCD04820.1 metalloregulator ArsR/SmtB family transcription factor [Erythrobacteraceae bacterium CFH 75059]